MSKKSTWFVVATEGATTDGRLIERDWITQMAKNYDPKNKLGARVNLEHIKFSLFLEGFAHSKAYGDVLGLKSEQREDGKFQLLAQISPTDELVNLINSKQKVYTSIEVDPDFADTGEAYLVGLAVTDTPASLGTSMLEFASTATENPLSNRKMKPTNLFSAAVEFNLAFEYVGEADKPSLFNKIKTLFSDKSANDKYRFHDVEQAIELIANKTEEQDEEIVELTKQLKNANEKFSNVQQQLTQLAQQPKTNYNRPAITGKEESSTAYF